MQQALLHHNPAHQANPSNLQTPAQPLASSSAPQQPGSGAIQPAVDAVSAQPERSRLATQTSEATRPGSAEEKQKKEGSPSGGTKQGSPGAGAGAGDGPSPSKQVKMMTGILEVLSREVLNPASTKETRDAAHSCLQVVTGDSWWFIVLEGAYVLVLP